MLKKIISMMLSISIIALSSGCTSILLGNKISQNRLVKLYQDEGCENMRFSEIENASDDLLYGGFLRYDDELDGGVYATVDSERELKRIFQSDSFVTTSFLEYYGIVYSRDMTSGTYYIDVDFRNSNEIAILTAVAVDFSSSDDLNDYYENCLTQMERLASNANGFFDSGEDDNVDYAFCSHFMNDTELSDTGYLITGVYSCGNKLLIVSGIGLNGFSSRLETMVDDFSDLVGIVSANDPTAIRSMRSLVNEDVYAAIEDFARNVCELNAANIVNIVRDCDDDTAEALEFIVDYCNSDDILSVIVDSLTYEINMDSIEVSSDMNSASANVIFTYVDVDSVYDDIISIGGDRTEFINALENSEVKVAVETTLEFVLLGGEWLLDDPELECIEAVFGFLDSDYVFYGDFMDAYEGYSWYAADSDDTYTNAYYINFWATYDSSNITEYPEFYFTVEHDGSLVYTSETSSSCDCYFYASDYTGDDHLPEGTYTITLYLEDGTYIDSGSTYVYYDPTTPISTSGDYLDLWANGIEE